MWCDVMCICLKCINIIQVLIICDCVVCWGDGNSITVTFCNTQQDAHREDRSNLVYILQFIFLRPILNTILISTTRILNLPLLLRFSDHNIVYIYPAFGIFPYPTIFYIIILEILDARCKLWPYHYAVSSNLRLGPNYSFLGPNVLHSSLFSNTFNFIRFLGGGRRVSKL
jgi:hypothetical protein